MTREKMETSQVQVAELDGNMAGVARLCIKGETAELAALFVEPGVQKAGVGRALFDWSVAECRKRSVRRMLIEADPGAASFYRHMGAQEVGLVPSSSIPGRSLPQLELVLH